MEESADFYRRVFGLERGETAASKGETCCQMVDPSHNEDAFRIILVQGLPASTELAGMDHVSFEAADRSEVNAIYARALQSEARATAPRVLDGFYQAYVFDPTGYKIEIVARATESHTPSM